MLGEVGGEPISFLLDTGAAVTLIGEDVWRRVNAKQPTKLQPWSEQKLVGVDGSPLEVHGQVHVTVVAQGNTFETQALVVSPLTTEGILGLDFLKKHQATIDVRNRQLRLGSCDCNLSLVEARTPHTTQTRVCATATISIPPNSEVEVMACLSQPVQDGTWLLEEVPGKRHAACVARAVVSPQGDQVVVRLLNPRPEPVKVYSGSHLATLEPVEGPIAVATATGESVSPAQPGKETPVSQEKQELLWGMVEKAGAGLEESEKMSLYQLLLAYSDVFSSSGTDLGRTGVIQHRITTTTTSPIRQPIRRIPPYRREEVQQLLREMQEKDVIQRSSSPWASPIVLVTKKDGSTRFCVDYRRLNEVTRKDAYPLPRIDMTLDTLAGARWFSTLDLVSGYWQVEVAEEDRNKTAFCTTEGLFEFKVMPFGLCNAPATFQRLMDFVLAGLNWAHCLVYLDDVIVLGRSFSEHLLNLQMVFARLREAGLMLKPAKCTLFREEVQFLGHLVSREGVRADPANVERVATWPTPTTKREVQQFLGFASYYRRFIKDFAGIAKPLHRLTEEGDTFRWTDECERAFEKLRHLLTTTPLLAYPDFDRPFILDTDASAVGIGAVLSQIDNTGQERVVAYGSRVLSKAERQYCVTRRELLAVVTFIRQFKPYLTGRRFQLRTDHGSLVWLRNFKEPEGQLARWLECLQEYDFEIVHRRGRKHTNADALSRLPCRQCGRDTHSPAIIAATPIMPRECQQEDLRTAQLADADIAPALQAKQTDQRPGEDRLKEMSLASRRLVQLWEQLVVRDGILYRLFEDPVGREERLQLVVPRLLRDEILTDLHEGELGGHLGIEKTLARLKERFYWPGHHQDVQNWCGKCAVCASRKNPTQAARAPLTSIKVGNPMQLVAVDILGPLLESEAGNSYILVAADYFTRWVEAYPIPNQEATTVAKKLTDELFFRFSPPEQLHSDQGRQFESTVIAEVCKLLGITKSRTTPYHPQGDGLVERFNRTLLAMLATAVQERPFEWEEHLRRLCMAYNTSVHPTTGYTPFYLMFGRQARMPIDILYGTPTPQVSSPAEYAGRLRQDLELAYHRVRVQLGHKLCRQKDLYDRKVHGRPYECGELVWLYSPVVPRGQSKKLRHPWTGPFRVVRKLSDAVYRIQNTQVPRQRLVVHFDRLKSCPSDIRLPVTVPPASLSTGNRPGEPSLQPPGTTLEIVDDVDPTDCHLQRQQLPRRSSRYPQRQRSAPDYYSPGFN